jgi:hypothetical protein
MKISVHFPPLALLLAAAMCVAAPADAPTIKDLPQADQSPFSARVVVDASRPARRMDPRRIGGTNLALWNEARHFQSPLLRKWITELGTGLIRLPGGSWSNGYFWNGNGVRNDKGEVDPSRVGPDGYPAVDYSDYRQGFMVDSKTLKPIQGFHGNVDIRTLHEYIKATPGAVGLPSINAGTGRPVDAAEWAKWSLANGYEAGYWHVGNELGGSWEPGTVLPDGSTITGDIFAARFNAIADAVHQVDPKAKLGSFAFGEDILRASGDRVAFVSIHTYPGSTTLTPQENLARVPQTVANEVNQVRGWIEKYQPNRKGEIEIGYTEWNLAGGMTASDLFSGLWTSMMLGEFARNGVSFATKWDTFTHTRGMAGGHGLIFTDGDKYTRKAGYYALQLWNHYSGDEVLTPTVESPAPLSSYASRDAGAVFVMIVNPNDSREANVEIDLAGFDAGPRGEIATLSSREYFWNNQTHIPEWSRPPRVRAIATGKKFTVPVAPFSVAYVRIPAVGAPAESKFLLAQEAAPAPEGKPAIRFILPPEIYVGDKLVGYVAAENADDLPPAELTAAGDIALDRKTVRLAENLGRFEFRVGSTEPAELKASVNGAEATAKISAKSSVPRPMLIWDFQKESPAGNKMFDSRYKLTADLNQRPNKEVARIDLKPEDFIPGDKEHKVLFRINRLPEKDALNRENIRGVFFDLRTIDLKTEDPNASVSVVMQSPADFWMVVGTVPLAGNTDWKHHEVTFSRPSHLDAVGSAYNIWFVLNTGKPVSGTVLIDRIGLMVR